MQILSFSALFPLTFLYSSVLLRQAVYKVRELLPQHLDLIQCFGLWARYLDFWSPKENLSTWNIVGCQSRHPDSAFFQSNVEFLIIYLCFNFMISNCVYTNLAPCLIARLTLFEDLSFWFVQVFRIFLFFWVCARDPNWFYNNWKYCSSVCSKYDWLF